ncbi:hypothetical protein GJAV_G00022930 [Gymnothorax javanicus]|nr:hypothetical protein GJAV_G00022930 [Gymnothorax javanicus]
MEICGRSCLDIWEEENNGIITRLKCDGKSQEIQGMCKTKRYYTEIHKLLLKIQGVPCVPASVRLELTVLYNTSLLGLSLSELTETPVLLARGLARALEAQGCQGVSGEAMAVWRAVLQAFAGSEHLIYVQQLLCAQWALWLCTDQLQDLWRPTSAQEVSADLFAVIRDLRFSIDASPTLSVAVPPKELRELVHICTDAAAGMREMEKGRFAEALHAFDRALSLPTPRGLLAQLHTLAGMCLEKQGEPQSALQCFRKALEVDFSCHHALYQSSVLYGRLGNTGAEIEALGLLHAAVTLPGCGDPSQAETPLLCPEALLRNHGYSRILAPPSPLGVLHTLAHRCLCSLRIPEAAQHYLDLLTSLQADGTLLVNTGGSPSLPRVPEIYLEAAFALIKAERYCDAAAVCEEVISQTVDLVPESLVLELPVGLHGGLDPVGSASLCGRNGENAGEKLNFVLWAAASYLLQGQACSLAEDNAAAAINFTRSLNVLLTVLVKSGDVECGGSGSREADGLELQTLQRLKGLALAGRGVCSMRSGKLKEALQDLQLSLQASPGMQHADMWLMEALWQLGRKDEAMSKWRRTGDSAQRPALREDTPGGLPVYLQYRLQSGISEPEGLIRRIEDFIQSRGDSACDRL